MKKNIITIIIIAVSCRCLALDFNYTIIYKSYIYAEFSTESYTFSTLIDPSTSCLFVNNQDLDSFIHSLYFQTCIYTHTFLYDYYCKLYGTKRDIVEAATQTMNVFNIQKKRKGRHKRITLKNRRTIDVEYFNISGLFMSFLSKDNKWSYSSNSIIYPNYKEITTVMIPIYIISYSKSPKLHLKFYTTHKFLI